MASVNLLHRCALTSRWPEQILGMSTIFMPPPPLPPVERKNTNTDRLSENRGWFVNNLFGILLLLVKVLSLFFCLFFFLLVYLLVSGWLKDSDHEVIRRVSQRIEDLTGLTMDTAEELQVH